MPPMWTAIGAVVSAFLLLGVVLAVLDPANQVSGVVLALGVAVCALPVVAGYKLDQRRKRP